MILFDNESAGVELSKHRTQSGLSKRPQNRAQLRSACAVCQTVF